jgi:hypothetical protein
MGPMLEYPKVIRLGSAAPALITQSRAANNTITASLLFMLRFNSLVVIERQPSLKFSSESLF